MLFTCFKWEWKQIAGLYHSLYYVCHEYFKHGSKMSCGYLISFRHFFASLWDCNALCIQTGNTFKCFVLIIRFSDVVLDWQTLCLQLRNTISLLQCKLSQLQNSISFFLRNISASRKLNNIKCKKIYRSLFCFV